MEDQDDDNEILEASTLRGEGWPCLRQFCVFLENRVGRLNELMRQVESPESRVVALSIVDSVDFAMVRLIFNNADRAREKLSLSQFLFSENDVVGVELPLEADKPLAMICGVLIKGELNIHHSYPLMYHRRGRAAVAVYVDDVDMAQSLLRDAGLRIITEDTLAEDEMF